MSFAIGRLTAEAPNRDEERIEKLNVNVLPDRFERLADAREALRVQLEPGPWLIVEFGLFTWLLTKWGKPDHWLPRWDAIEYAFIAAGKAANAGPRASLAFMRLDHTAALLPDGRVLVAGGVGFPSAALELSDAGIDAPLGGIRTCEIYDPRNDQWSDAGELELTHGGATATVLADGRVLLAGGWTTSGGRAHSVAECEIYDPVSRIWRLTGSLNEPRTYHRSVLLEDGHVLALGGSHGAGGYSGTWPQLASVEVFDPQRETWSVNGSLRYRRSWRWSDTWKGGAVRLADDTVLVHRGSPRNETHQLTVELGVERYDPRTGTSRLERPSPPPREIPFGQVQSSGPPEPPAPWDALMYAPWVGLLRDKTVLFVGRNWQWVRRRPRSPVWGLGLSNYDGSVPLAGICDPADGRWKLLPTSGERLPSNLEAYVLLHDGRLLVTCGRDAQPNHSNYLASSWLFDPATGEWSRTGDMAVRGRTAYTTTLLLDGRVLVTGGMVGKIWIWSHSSREPRTMLRAKAFRSEIYDPISGSWRLTGSNPEPTGR